MQDSDAILQLEYVMHPLQRALLGTLSLATLYLAACVPLTAQQSPDTTPSGAPATMHLCVETSCEKLVWRGTYYDGIKDNGSDIVNHYTVSQWSKQAIRLEGKSIAPISQNTARGPFSSKSYMEASFAGTISQDGNSIDNGVVNWKMGKLSGEKVFKLTWEGPNTATPVVAGCAGGTETMPPPSALLVCDGFCLATDNGDFSEWSFVGSHGMAFWVRGMKANLTIEDWSGGNVTIRREDRTDSATAGVSAIYHGTICGNVIKGTFAIDWPAHPLDKAKGAWKADIITTTCDGVGEDTRLLMDRAIDAIRFRQQKSAFACLLRAANLGDMDARTATGIMYRDGAGVQTSYPEALKLLRQAAIQGKYDAQLAMAQMYELGLGVPKDPKEGEQWRTRAYNNPVAVAAREAGKISRHREDMMFLGIAAMFSAMTTPTVYIERPSLF